MRKKQPYEHTFFRRPILTAENIRFWWILGTVSVLLTILVWQSIGWADRLPSRVVASRIKKKYISFLARQQTVSQPLEKKSVAENSPRMLSDLEMDVSKTIESSLSRLNRKRSAYREMLNSTGKESVRDRSLSFTSEGGVEPITAVVENVPGLIVSPGYTGRSEKSLRLRNEEEILGRYEQPIHIPEPEVFQFASHNGNRDLFETTAIMEVNEVDIRFCFEKLARFDPTFSGDVLVSFTIHPEGYVIPSSIKIVKSNIRDPRILRCIKKSIQRWKNFPRIALEDGLLTVTRKYVF